MHEGTEPPLPVVRLSVLVVKVAVVRARECPPDPTTLAGEEDSDQRKNCDVGYGRFPGQRVPGKFGDADEAVGLAPLEEPRRAYRRGRMRAVRGVRDL